MSIKCIDAEQGFRLVSERGEGDRVVVKHVGRRKRNEKAKRKAEESDGASLGSLTAS